VAVMHFDVYSHLHTLPFVWNSYLFVDFFFVLSGFVISASYEKRFLHGFSVGQFMLWRLGRVYPLHLFMLACFVCLEVLRSAVTSSGPITEIPIFTSNEQSLGAVAANVVLVHGLDVFDCLTWNRPSWSISTEFFTYLIFAWTLVWLRKRVYLAIGTAMIVSPIVLACVSDHNMNTTFDYGLIRCVYGFAAGIAAFRIYALFVRKARAPINRVVATLAEGTSLAMVLLFVLVAGERTISVLAPYVFLITIVVFSVERGYFSKLMMYRPLAMLGTLSYSIYMVHLFVQARLFDIGQLLEAISDVDVLTYVDAEHKQLLGTHLWYGDLLHLAMLPVVIAVSHLTYRFIEEPSRAWFRAFSQRLTSTEKSRPKDSFVHTSELGPVPVGDAGQAF
jgi:peptidoglycan/LPS O-acetylase OafA/YrhL